MPPAKQVSRPSILSYALPPRPISASRILAGVLGISTGVAATFSVVLAAYTVLGHYRLADAVASFGFAMICGPRTTSSPTVPMGSSSKPVA